MANDKQEEIGEPIPIPPHKGWKIRLYEHGAQAGYLGWIEDESKTTIAFILTDWTIDFEWQ